MNQFKANLKLYGNNLYHQFQNSTFVFQRSKVFLAKEVRNNIFLGCRHNSVDSSAPSILPPQVRVPSTPSMLFSIYIVQTVYLSIEFECEKNKNKQKRPGLAHF